MAANEPPSVKILALGMPRTGTGSIKLALEHLSFGPVHHGLDVINQPQESLIWNEHLRKKHFDQQTLSRKDLDRLFHGYVADDLLDAYPEAKLILVQRDLEPWFYSFKHALLRDLFTFKSMVFKHVAEPVLGTQFVDMGEMMMLSFFNATSRSEFDANARDKYLQYYSNAREAAKIRGRTMLEYRMAEGWEPLFRFLKHNVPDISFPRANEEAAILRFWAEVERRMWMRFGVAVGRYSLPLLLLLAAGILYLWIR